MSSAAGGLFFQFLCRGLIFGAVMLRGVVQADETKAANHIDFTSVPYEGPALKKGQELLAQSREQTKQETAKGPSLQRGWYYSGQLDHMVLWEKGVCAPCRKRSAAAAFPTRYACRSHHVRPCVCSALADKVSAGNSNPIYKTCNTMYGSQPTMAEVRRAQAALDTVANSVQGSHLTQFNRMVHRERSLRARRRSTWMRRWRTAWTGSFPHTWAWRACRGARDLTPTKHDRRLRQTRQHGAITHSLIFKEVRSRNSVVLRLMHVLNLCSTLYLVSHLDVLRFVRLAEGGVGSLDSRRAAARAVIEQTWACGTVRKQCRDWMCKVLAR